MILYRFCPLCGTSLVAKIIDDRERRVCPTCKYIQWGNSKTTAATLVVNNQGEMLFGKRNIDPYRGWWIFPGGFLESGEHPEDGARRELREEAGLEVGVLTFLGVFNETYADTGTEGDDLLNFYYSAHFPAGATITASDDVELLQWIAPETLDLETLAFPANRAVLRQWLAQNPPRS